MPYTKRPKSRLKPPGETLPKRILRPYFHMADGPIDDKQYRETSPGDKTISLSYLYTLLYMGAIILLSLWPLTRFEETLFFLCGVLCLGLAVWLNKYANRAKTTRFNTFDRETGICCFPWGSWGNIKNEFPFAECEGRISRGARRTGTSCHILWLYHPQIGVHHLFESISGIDRCLGYWSFLVQYMDKNAPLPDVPHLQQYPNRTPGLGSWDDWERKVRDPNFSDPYDEWQLELRRNPKLDIAYYWDHPEEAPWNQGDNGSAKTSKANEA